MYYLHIGMAISINSVGSASSLPPQHCNDRRTWKGGGVAQRRGRGPPQHACKGEGRRWGLARKRVNRGGYTAPDSHVSEGLTCRSRLMTRWKPEQA